MATDATSFKINNDERSRNESPDCLHVGCAYILYKNKMQYKTGTSICMHIIIYMQYYV